MIEIRNYEDMSHMTADDILSFMKNQSPTDIEEFKTYCNTPLTIEYKDGSTKTRRPVFFEIRRYVIDKYFPDALKAGATGGKKGITLLDRINSI